MIKQIIYFLILIALLGCSSNKVKDFDYNKLGVITNSDYIDHLASIGESFLNFRETQVIKIPQETHLFLEKIYDRLVSNNQQLLAKSDRPKFYFVKHNSPFLFSLPKSQFYFSSALLVKYLKSEELFVAALSAEVLRSQRAIYEKKILIPIGIYNIEKMLQLTKLKIETKQQVNEWAYFVLKRAGYDSSAYLNWIQVQNRNTLDFALYLGDLFGISKEEHLFKNFMTKQGAIEGDRKFNEANSSKEFYKLINILAR